MPLPDPDQPYPITLPDGTPHKGTVMLRAVIDHPGWEVGAFTYASDFDPPRDWASHLAPYLFPFSSERLRIGKFCQIAHGVRFVTASANHQTRAFSTYPFPIFDAETRAGYQPDRRDTEIGHDVWIGKGAMILPGSRIGHGAIIGAGAVVRGTVAPYSVVAGNPGAVLRPRFDKSTIETLLSLAWWDWPPARIEAAQTALQSLDPDHLKAFSQD